MFQASALVDEYRSFDADSAAAVTAAVEGAGSDLGFITLKADEFARATAKSVDYAVMEKTSHAAVVPVSYRWSDVGSWQAVWDLADKDSAGNASQGTVVFVDSKSSYAASDKAVVSLFGVEDLVVVSSEDAVLVADRHNVDGMRQLVRRLKEVTPRITEDHVTVHRPWGTYSLVAAATATRSSASGEASCRLSLQLHHHRAEHWVIVRGTARVTVGGGQARAREPVDLYSARRGASVGESRHDRSGVDRGPVRRLSRRGRHCSDRGRLSPLMKPMYELGHGDVPVNVENGEEGIAYLEPSRLGCPFRKGGAAAEKCTDSCSTTSAICCAVNHHRWPYRAAPTVGLTARKRGRLAAIQETRQS